MAVRGASSSKLVTNTSARRMAPANDLADTVSYETYVKPYKKNVMIASRIIRFVLV